VGWRSNSRRRAVTKPGDYPEPDPGQIDDPGEDPEPQELKKK